VAATAAGLLASDAHPSAAEGEAEITDKERYGRIRHLLGDAVATPVAGLHVHVGMPDAETAIRAFNGVRKHLRRRWPPIRRSARS
jgi:carboxylate-amine ligase